MIDVACLADRPSHVLPSDSCRQIMAPTLSEPAWHLLQAMPRFAARLETLLGTILGPADIHTLMPEDREIIEAGAAFWQRSAAAAGGLLYQGAIRLIVSGADVTKLVSICGADARLAALTFVRPDGIGIPAKAGGEGVELLIAAIRTASLAAYADWLWSLPEGFARRVAALWPIEKSDIGALTVTDGASVFRSAAHQLLRQFDAKGQ